MRTMICDILIFFQQKIRRPHLMLAIKNSHICAYAMSMKFNYQRISQTSNTLKQKLEILTFKIVLHPFQGNSHNQMTLISSVNVVSKNNTGGSKNTKNTF